MGGCGWSVDLYLPGTTLHQQLHLAAPSHTLAEELKETLQLPAHLPIGSIGSNRRGLRVRRRPGRVGIPRGDPGRPPARRPGRWQRRRRRASGPSPGSPRGPRAGAAPAPVPAPHSHPVIPPHLIGINTGVKPHSAADADPLEAGSEEDEGVGGAQNSGRFT